MTTPAGVVLDAGLGEENSRKRFLGSRSGGRKSLQAFSGKQVEAGLAEENSCRSFPGSRWKQVWRMTTPAGLFLGEENSRKSFLGSRSGGRKSLQAFFSGKQVNAGLAE